MSGSFPRRSRPSRSRVRLSESTSCCRCMRTGGALFRRPWTRRGCWSSQPSSAWISSQVRALISTNVCCERVRSPPRSAVTSSIHSRAAIPAGLSGSRPRMPTSASALEIAWKPCSGFRPEPSAHRPRDGGGGHRARAGRFRDFGHWPDAPRGALLPQGFPRVRQARNPTLRTWARLRASGDHSGHYPDTGACRRWSAPANSSESHRRP